MRKQWSNALRGYFLSCLTEDQTKKGGEKLKRKLIYGFMAVGVLSLVFGGAIPVWAGSLKCGDDCGWEIAVDGVTLASGGFNIDDDGNTTIDGNPSVGGEEADFSASVDSFSAQVDPELVVAASAVNRSNAPKTFSFAFSLPIALSGDLPIETYASLGTTLTASSAGDGTVFPTLGVNKIMDSQDIGFFPSVNVDKGVDIGDALVDPAGGLPTTAAVEAFGLIEAGQGSFNLMSVVIAFGLVDTAQAAGNDGQVSVGFSGLVQQTPVPVPAAIWLLGTGLLALIGFRKRFQR
jgi:hypothetical protein